MLYLRAKTTGWRHSGQVNCSPISSERARSPWKPSSRSQCMPAWYTSVGCSKPRAGFGGHFGSKIEGRTWVQAPKRGDGTFPEAGEGNWANIVSACCVGREEVAACRRTQGDEQSAKSENRPHQVVQMVCAPHVPGTGRQTRGGCTSGWLIALRCGERGGGTRPNTRQDDNRAWPDQGVRLPTSLRAC